MKYKIIKVRRMFFNKKQKDARDKLKKFLHIPFIFRLMNYVKFWGYFFRIYYFLYLNKKIIGCCVVYENIITALIINPKYQHKGYGRVLLNHVLTDLKAQGKRNILLACNNLLRTYYEKFGFKEKPHFIQMQLIK